MREDDIAILEAATDETLAQWWSEMNAYGWPGAFADPEPEKHIPGGRRTAIMCWIMDKIGLKECLRYWNRESMTSEVFDSWYDDGLGRFAKSHLT